MWEWKNKNEQEQECESKYVHIIYTYKERKKNMRERDIGWARKYKNTIRENGNIKISEIEKIRKWKSAITKSESARERERKREKKRKRERKRMEILKWKSKNRRVWMRA